VADGFVDLDEESKRCRHFVISRNILETPAETCQDASCPSRRGAPGGEFLGPDGTPGYALALWGPLSSCWRKFEMTKMCSSESLDFRST
jgi:hypothetical protein